jgi:hypothetical protein
VGDPPAWGLGGGLTTLPVKLNVCYETLQTSSDQASCCECGDEPSGSCATELVTAGVSEAGHAYNIKMLSLY